MAKKVKLANCTNLYSKELTQPRRGGIELQK